MRKRKYKRRYTRRKGYRRRSFRRRSNRPEVKYVDINNLGQAVKTQNLALGTTDLYNADAFGPANAGGLLSAITQGTAANQRIGNKIFVKSISFHLMPWICPASDNSDGFDIVLYRCLFAGTPTYFGGSNTSDFWSHPLTTHMHDFPRRANYKVYFDKVIRLQASSVLQGINRAGRGDMRLYKFKLAFKNRTVEYKDGTNMPKYVEDRILGNNFCFSPSVPNNVQLVCATWGIRIYYTDV